MKTSQTSMVAVIVGSILGWGTSVALKHDDGGTPPADKKAPVPTKRIVRAKNLSWGNLADVQACRDLLEASKIPDARHPLLRRLDKEQALRRWIELDPAGALTEAERNPSSGFAKDLFRAWIELNPSGALDALNGANRTLAGAVATDFFVALMAKDPALASEELKSAKWRSEGTAFLGWSFHHDVYQQWMRADPVAAIASLGKPDSDIDIMSPEYGMAEAWAEMDFKTAWNHYFPEGSGDPLRTSHGENLLARGLLTGSADALGILESMSGKTQKNGDSDSYHRQAIADRMVDADPNAAIQWAHSRPADDWLRLLIMAKAARAVSSSDPELALSMLKESGGSKHDWEDAGTLRESYAALAAEDPIQTAERIHQLPPDQRSDAISGYLTRVFTSDPDAAIRQCRAWLADPELNGSLPKAWAKAFSWGHGAGARNPSEVLAAIPELNDAVDENVLSTWTKANPEGAAAWITQRVNQGKRINFGNEGILADLAISKPEFTATWLMELPDAAVQKTAAGTLAANWGAFDPAAAQRWIESLPEGDVRQAAEDGLKRINQ